jgi:hypothetical protein
MCSIEWQKCLPSNRGNVYHHMAAMCSWRQPPDGIVKVGAVTYENVSTISNV